MSQSSNKSETEKQLEALRTELAEFRAVAAMHRQTQEGLDTIERQLAGIIHSAMDAIITINDEQKIILFNAAAETMFVCSAKSAIGQSIDGFIPQRFRGVHRQHVDEFRDREMTNRRMGALGAIWVFGPTERNFRLKHPFLKCKVEKKAYLPLSCEIFLNENKPKIESHDWRTYLRNPSMKFIFLMRTL
jgi:PAS domain-containing protein